MESRNRLEEIKEDPTQHSQAVRKQVTVLFCDIANYTERTAAMDPEDLSEEIREFQSICTRIAETYQGHISNYLGDGIMILFGHPHASEFSPERAVRAGLEMVESIKTNNRSPRWESKKPLAIRIGIATGLVVVGDRAGKKRDQDELIFGNAPNLAARLQAIAKPNTVVTALRTRRLVGLAFKFKDLGHFDLKGFSQPASAWQILYERKLQKRSGNILRRNTSTFISRKKELMLLDRNFDNACYGFSRFIHINGEPGIGKTRLIRTFEKSVTQPEIHRMRINCSPYYQNSFLRPVSEECQRWLQISESDDLATRQASITWALSIINMDQRDQHLLFTDFLGIPAPSEIEVLDISPEEKRSRIINILARVIMEVSKVRPVLLVAEDLHWADPSTLDLLIELMKQASEERIFGIFTSRNHFKPPWKEPESLSTITLEGLTQVESRRLVESVFENHYLPESLKQNLVHKSDGVPLFLEESCLSAISHMQKVADTGNTTVPLDYDVPETLQDSLNARLDQLGETKSLAQLASTFGESFAFSTISEIARLNNIDADSGVDLLIGENILVQETVMGEDRFKFRHVMFQEAAYQSLLIKTRQHYHQQIAELFLTRDPNFADKHPELLAHHFSKTEQIPRAIELWLKAGETAIEKSAFAESIDHLHQGLALSKSLEPTSSQQHVELLLLLNLGVSLTARAGYYGYEVTRTYERAVELAQKVGDDREEWTALYGLWRCQISQAEYGKGVRLATVLGTLSETIGDPMLRLTTSGIKGMSRLVDGKLDKADRFIDRAVALYDEVDYKKVGLRFGQDPFVTIQGLGAVTKLLRGEIPQSVKAITRSVDVAREIGHPYTIGETLKLASMYEQISRNMEQLRLYCLEAIDISEQYGFEGVLATHRIFLAFADLIRDGNLQQIEIMKDNLILYEQKYGLLFLPYFQGVFAEALLMVERYEEAFETANSILQDIDQSGENWVRPVTLCIKSEAAIKGDLATPTDCKRWYLESLDTAARQDSRLMLGRTLKSHDYFKLDAEAVRGYRQVAEHGDSSLLFANHEYIARRH
ncbi:MAG: adenylate/guanylate cyclase domain-containing protein [bacterium]